MTDEFCGSCGKKGAVGDQYCTHCGHKIFVNKEENNESILSLEYFSKRKSEERVGRFQTKKRKASSVLCTIS